MKRFLIAAVSALLILSGCGSADTADNAEETAKTSQSEEKKEEEKAENTENTENGDDEMDNYKIAEVKDPALYDLQFTMPEKGEEIAVIQTSMGDIKVRFFPEEAPLAVENFKTLAKNGFYDGLIFHRVYDEFMIQGGDPTGTGTGFASAFDDQPFGDEFVPYLHNYRGSLSMANSGADSNGCQFFINQASSVYEEYVASLIQARDESEGACFQNVNKGTFDMVADVYPDAVVEHYREVGGNIHLDYKHTVFGQVIEGMDVVDAIAKVPANADGKPDEDVIIEKVYFENYEG